MIIDFRLRPPLGNFPNMVMYDRDRNPFFARLIGFEPAPSAVKLDMKMTLQEMDEAGVTHAVIPGRTNNPVMGAVTNEQLKQMLLDYPGKFFSFAGVDPTDMKAALDIVQNEVVNGPFSGINIEPGQLPWPQYAHDRRFYPLYDACQELDVPIIAMLGGNAGPDISFQDPAQIDRVMIDFPKLKVVISHGGWPYVTEILHVAWRRHNLYISPDMYLFNFPGWQDYVTAANGYLQDRFLYGTSYPILPIVGCMEAFKKMPFKPEVMPKLLYKNAARLLKLDVA